MSPQPALIALNHRVGLRQPSGAHLRLAPLIGPRLPPHDERRQRVTNAPLRQVKEGKVDVLRRWRLGVARLTGPDQLAIQFGDMFTAIVAKGIAEARGHIVQIAVEFEKVLAQLCWKFSVMGTSLFTAGPCDGTGVALRAFRVARGQRPLKLN